MSEKDGGPAWPTFVAISPSGDAYPGFSGMSLRDWFAGQALAGIISIGEVKATPAEYAEASFMYADAMLKARTQGE